jgi:glutamate synthase (NADPH/NADH) large chain
MAQLGFRTVNEMVGQVDVLQDRFDLDFWKLKKIDLSPVLYRDPDDKQVGIYKMIDQDHGLQDVLDWDLLEKAKPAFDTGEFVFAEFPVRNIDRAVGAILSNEISKKFEDKGLPEGTIHYKFRGSAGQSFGAFSAKGLKFELEGEANDYFGKGLSGAQLIVYPFKESKYIAEENFIVGNVSFYGATSGEAYIRGLAGERFCVRNSGAKVVVEGVGDHGCEYMTGGVAVILGETGRNFAAGMSGGVAYVHDPQLKFERNCNKELVLFEPLEDEDKTILKKMIENHHKFTGSPVAAKILEDWDRNLFSFTKVMPKDYKAALLKRKKKELKGQEGRKSVELV